MKEVLQSYMSYRLIKFLDIGSLQLGFLQKGFRSFLFSFSRRSRVSTWPLFLPAYGTLLQLHGKELESERKSSIMISEVTY